jgi:hypothetical protein
LIFKLRRCEVNKLKKSLSFALSLYMIFFQLGVISQAQTEEEGSIQNRNPASQYYLERGTESKLMIKVNVWGAVEKPGSQYVPDGSDLISVLSAAGGPIEGAKLSQIRLVRNFDGEKRNMIINVKKCLKKGEPGELPEIKPGDTIVVPKSRVSFGKFITVIYNVAVIASVVKLMSN